MNMIRKFTAWVSGALICTLMLSANANAKGTTNLSDPEIASVAVTANQVDIGYAELALKKSKDKAVREFATTMSSDHKAIIQQAVDLVTKLHVTPKDNAVSKSLMDGANKTKKMLNSKSGKAFDKAYIDNEVAYHKAVISTVENVLIPQAKNGELKALLEKVVPTLKAHLAHAEMVQANFK